MTNFDQWCDAATVTAVGRHTLGLLVSSDDEAGVGHVAQGLPGSYAESEALARIAERRGKPGVAEFLRRKFPQTQGARSGDLGEILATAYLGEELGYVVGPSRLIQRDHQEWAMRGDDVLGAKFDTGTKVLLVKGEAKSRAKMRAGVIGEAREGLQRAGGLPSPHSLVQFGERLLGTANDALGEAVLDLELARGVRPKAVTHLMFLFAGNDPSIHVSADLEAYDGAIAQQAMILLVKTHQDFIRATFEKAIAGDA